MTGSTRGRMAWIGLLAVFAAEAAEPAADWAERLPANRWVHVDEQNSGNRIGANVRWLADEKRLLVEGGLHSESNREPKRPNRMAFDPATRTWAEFTGSVLEGPRLTITDGKRFKVSASLLAECAALAGERVAANSPLVDVSPIWIKELPVTAGELALFDPVNREVVLVGGSSPATTGGALGNWIYSIERNQWTPLDDRVDRAPGRDREQRELVARARNLLHASGGPAERAVGLNELTARQTQWEVKTKEDFAWLARAKPDTTRVDAVTLEAARRLVDESLIAARTAREAFAAGRVDAAVIAAADDAAWRIDEAQAVLATSPTPRRHARAAYDPDRKQFVLFGGDHGDYTLGDTWVYECAHRHWRRVWTKTGPEPRYAQQMFWSARDKRIVLLAGTMHLRKVVYQRLEEPLPPDVWVFDPAMETWQLAVEPGPETKKLSKDNMPVFLVNNPAAMLDNGVLIVPAVGGNDYHAFMVSSTWMLRIDARAIEPKANETPARLRRYRSEKVDAYKPQWYDSAPPGDAKDVDAMIAAMPANQWVKVPIAPRPCPERSWGTAIYDPVGDQILYWTGGHCADPADIVHHYHPGTNRWSIGYVAGGGVLGNGLTGRPDCANHTYKNYAWDPLSRMMVAVHRAGTHVYDPTRRDWVAFTKNQPFSYNLYGSKVVCTPRGVVGWVGRGSSGYFGLFDVANQKWTALPVNKGIVPPDFNGDEEGMTWDSMRNVLYLQAAKSYQKPDGRIHRYDFATGEVAVLDPAGREAIGDRFYQYRETVYLPDVDLVLFGMGWVNGREVAFDPGKNRWVTLDITRTSTAASRGVAGTWTFSEPKKDEHVGSISFAPVLDTRRNMLWAPSDYKDLYAMKIDPATLKVSAAE